MQEKQRTQRAMFTIQEFERERREKSAYLFTKPHVKDTREHYTNQNLGEKMGLPPWHGQWQMPLGVYSRL